MDLGRTWYKKGEELAEEIRGTVLPEGEIAFWYVGQCGMIIKSCEVTVAVDVVLNDMVENGRSIRSYQPPFAPDQLSLDYILCTHAHGDHMAIPTVPELCRANPSATVIVPDGCVPELEKAGCPAGQIRGVRAKEIVFLRGLTLRTVQAAHPEHTLDEQGRDVALSYHLELNGASVLHTGDSYVTDQLVKDYTALPPVDLYMSPINGGDYFRTSNGIIGNFNFMETAHLFRLLGAKVMVPMHFDMIFGNICNPFPFIEILWDLVPNARFTLPALGERILYRR